MPPARRRLDPRRGQEVHQAAKAGGLDGGLRLSGCVLPEPHQGPGAVLLQPLR